MKAFTDISQSKKLAEILPLESADMTLVTDLGGEHLIGIPYIKEHEDLEELRKQFGEIESQEFPCWSLTALLDVLESEIDGDEGETYQLNIEKDGTWWNVWYRERYDEANPIETESTEDLVDACVAMIENLHEQNLL